MYQSMLVRLNRSVVATFSAIFALVLAVGGLLIAPSMALAAANVTAASGGTNISIDTTSAGGTGAYKSLSGPGITENIAGDIETGIHTISLPSGWEFDTASTTISIFVIGDIGLNSVSFAPSQTSFSFTVDSVSTSASFLGFSGLKVRPTTTTPSSGSMAMTAGTISGVTGSINFGTLTSVPGTVTKLAFTQSPSATTVYGSNFSTQPIVKTQDQFGNDSTNGAAGKTVTLTLAPSTGNIVGTASLDISSGTASFSGLTVDAVGTKQLTATAEGLTSADSSSFEITQKELTVSGLSVTSRQYDGTTNAEVTGTPSLVGAVDGDDVSVTGTAVGPFDSANAGSRTVAVTGLSLAGTDSGNYTLTQPTLSADITAKIITVTPNSGQTKVYGETDPAFTYTNTALIGEDSIGGALGRNAGEDVGEFSYTLGTLAAGDNYSLVLGGSETFAITQRPLTVEATASSKIYDGNTTSVGIPTITVGTLAEGDEANFIQAYSTTNVATGKRLTPSGTAGGNGGNNYEYTFTFKMNGTITEKELTVSGLSVADKVYDGNTNTTVNGTPVLVGKVGSDDVSLTGTAGGSFNDSNVGSRTVAVSGLSLSGVDMGNYSLTQPILGAEITALGITGSFTTENKVYDGNTTATVLTQSLDGVLSGDTGNVSLTGGTANFASENVGDGQIVTASGMALSGSAIGNYSLISVGTEVANIIPKPLTATVTVEKKVIDGNNSAVITDVSFDGVVDGETVIADFSGATASFADSEIGNGKEVIASGITINSGNELGNYSYDGSATGTGNILEIPTTVYVDDDWTEVENWEDPDGEAGPATYFGYDAFATIQDAIDAVAADGTVNVLAGTYIQDLVITKKLSLQGADKATTKIKGIATEPSTSFPLATPNIDIQADGVTISGFTIESPDVADGEYSSGVVLTGQNITITNNTFVLIQAGTPPESNDSNTSVAIQTYSKAAVPTSDVSGLTVSGNTFNGTPAKGYYGVYVNPDVGVGSVTISGNTLNGHIWRAITSERSNTTISGNTITNTDTGKTWGNSGIRVVDWGSEVIDSVSITGNTITGNGGLGTGILFGYSGAGHTLNNVVVTDNTITGSDSGVVVHVSSEEVSVNENTIQNNTLNLNNTDAALLNATNNYWGTAVADTIDGKISGLVDFDPYYVDSAKTILSSTVPTIISVDDGYTDGNSGSYYFGYDAFNTIQEGIEAVAVGGTVNVAAGTYDEQLQINKDVTISGATGATIQPTGDDDAWDIQFVAGGSGATLESFALDFNGVANNRPGRGMAVSDLNGPAVTNVIIQNNDITMGVGIGAATGGLEGVGIQTGKNANVSGLQVLNNQFHGGSTPITDGATQGEEGIYINPNTGTGAITISGNTFDGELFTGISVEADNVTVSGNAVNRSTVVQNTNGIRVNDFVGGVIYGVTASNNTVNKFENGFRLGSGSEGGSTLTVTLSGNIVTNNTRGIWVRNDAIVTANDNSISGNASFGAEILSDSDGTLNAVRNWWGTSTGPTHVSNTGGLGDAVSDNVTFRPWRILNDLTYTVDASGPSVTISSTATSPTSLTSIPFSVMFGAGEAVYDFTLADIIVTNGSASEPVVSGSSYTTNVTPSGAGAVTVKVNANTAWDASGNYNAVSNTASITYDNVLPTLSSVSIASDNDNDNDTLAKVGDTVTLSFTASENIGQPTVTIAGHTLLDSAVTGSGATWTATYTMTADDTEGVVLFTINFSDVAGNDGTAVTAITSGSNVTFDKTAPAVNLTSIAGDNYINNSEKAAIHVVGTAEAGSTVNVSLTGGVTVTGSGTATEGGTFDITIDGTTLTDGTVTPSVTATDATGNESAAVVTPTATKDTVAPTVDSHTPSVNEVNVESGDITVVFNEAVNVSDGQITLSPATSFTISGSGTDTITLTPDPLGSNTVYTVTVTTNVKDLANNAIGSAYSWSFTTATLYDVSLNADSGGWNLVSLPVVPNNTDIATVLGDAEGSIDAVWTYAPNDLGADDSGWFVYYPDNADGISNLSTMTAGYGYWVSVTADATLSGSGSLLTTGPTTPPSRTLASGWNLVGYYQIPGDDYSSMDDAFSSIGVAAVDYTSLWGYNNMTGAFSSVHQTAVDAIQPGEAFWISVPTSGKVYTPSNLN